MGAAVSHPVPDKPIIDFRLFFHLPTRKTIKDCYEISAATPPECTSSYKALRGFKSSTKPDLELFYADSPGTVLGSVKCLDGRDRSVFEITLGDDDPEPIDKIKRKSYAFSYKYDKFDYVWEITHTSLFGHVKEMTLRVRVEEDGKGDADKAKKTEEEGGEIVALWKVRSWLSPFETAFWIKRQPTLTVDEMKKWEIYVLLTGLGILNG